MRAFLAGEKLKYYDSFAGDEQTSGDHSQLLLGQPTEGDAAWGLGGGEISPLKSRKMDWQNTGINVPLFDLFSPIFFTKNTSVHVTGQCGEEWKR